MSSGRTSSALRNPKAGWVKIPATTTWIRSRCCCNDPKECKKISKSFMEIGDMRGQGFQLPSVSASTKSQEQKMKTKKGRLDRISAHFGKEISGSVDLRFRKAAAVDEPPSSTSQISPNNKEPKRHIAFIAAHHIDPVVLSKVGSKNTVELIFLKENGLWENGYTDVDRVKHLDGMCYVVPSYSMTDAKLDLAHLQHKEKLQDLVAKVVEDHQGKYQTRSEKRQRLSTPDEDRTVALESAVCMLHEQLEDLRNKQLSAATEETASGSSPDGSNARTTIEAFMKGKNGPLTRLTITSDIFHKNNPHLAKILFGRNKDIVQDDDGDVQPMSSWEKTKQKIWINFGLEHQEPTLESIRHSDGRNKVLSPFEESILTLIWVEKKFDRLFLAAIFGIRRNKIGEAIKRWAPEFAKCGYDVGTIPGPEGIP